MGCIYWDVFTAKEMHEIAEKYLIPKKLVGNY